MAVPEGAGVAVRQVPVPSGATSALNGAGAAGMQLLLLGFNAAIGGFLFGYDTGSMSSSLLQIKRAQGVEGGPCPGLAHRALSIQEQSMITSFVVLGAFMSATLAGTLNEHYGRRKVILGGSMLFFVGALMQAAAVSISTMLTARIVLGLGVGISSHTVPMYIAECAPSHLRGSLCFLNDLMIVVGQFTAAIVSTAFFFWEVRDGWRWILGLAAVPAIVMFLGVFMQPESPRWLLSKGRNAEARQIVGMLRGETSDVQAIEEDFNQMVQGTIAETSGAPGGPGFRSLVLNSSVRRALILGCGLMFLQQWTGINTIMYYGATVIQRAGEVFDVRDDNCFHDANKRDVAYTIFFAAAQLCGVIGSWFLVDRVGRRPLTFASLTGVTAFLMATGAAFTAEVVSKELVVCFVMLYLLFFGIGMSPVPWTVNAEIYPLHVRGQCISISTGTHWLMNFIVSQTFLILATKLSTNRADPVTHPNGVFWLYGTVSFCGLSLLWLHMPETKGLSLEQMDQLFTKPDDFRAM